jgi:hypothetical protein
MKKSTLARDENGKKECRKCKKWAELSFFKKNKRYADGLSLYCTDCVKAFQTAWWAEWSGNPKNHLQKREDARAKQLKRLEKMRAEVRNKYDNKCAHCGFDDVRALQIDHVNGDGHEHRKVVKGTNTFLAEVIKDTENRFQLLCANCNWIKRVKNQEYKVRREMRKLR